MLIGEGGREVDEQLPGHRLEELAILGEYTFLGPVRELGEVDPLSATDQEVFVELLSKGKLAGRSRDPKGRQPRDRIQRARTSRNLRTLRPDPDAVGNGWEESE